MPLSVGARDATDHHGADLDALDRLSCAVDHDPANRYRVLSVQRNGSCEQYRESYCALSHGVIRSVFDTFVSPGDTVIRADWLPTSGRS